MTLSEAIKERCLSAYEACNHNVSQTAKALGISRRAFYRRANRYGIILPSREHRVMPGSPKEKFEARSIVKWAIEQGLKVMPCEICQSTENVEAHHDDYSKPLDIRWLCQRHHREVHHPRQTSDDVSAGAQ